MFVFALLRDVLDTKTAKGDVIYQKTTAPCAILRQTLLILQYHTAHEFESHLAQHLLFYFFVFSTPANREATEKTKTYLRAFFFRSLCFQRWRCLPFCPNSASFFLAGFAPATWRQSRSGDQKHQHLADILRTCQCITCERYKDSQPKQEGLERSNANRPIQDGGTKARIRSHSPGGPLALVAGRKAPRRLSIFVLCIVEMIWSSMHQVKLCVNSN